MVMCSDKKAPDITCKNLPQAEFVHKVTFDLNDPKYEKAYWDFIDRLFSNGKWVILKWDKQDDPPYFEITGENVDLEPNRE